MGDDEAGEKQEKPYGQRDTGRGPISVLLFSMSFCAAFSAGATCAHAVTRLCETAVLPLGGARALCFLGCESSNPGGPDPALGTPAVAG